MATDQNNTTGQNGMGNGSSGYGGMSGQMQGGSMMRFFGKQAKKENNK